MKTVQKHVSEYMENWLVSRGFPAGMRAGIRGALKYAFNDHQETVNTEVSQVIQQRFSVTEMADIVGLSRARFYQLLKEGFFPEPTKDEGKTYYDEQGRNLCQCCRLSGLGVNGTQHMFYKSRGIKIV